VTIASSTPSLLSHALTGPFATDHGSTRVIFGTSG
jgi:hypothetical protein